MTRARLASVLGLIVGIGLAVGVGATARAGGAKPHIAKVTPPNPMNGSMIEVVGTNFSDELGDVKATIGGQHAIVLEAHIEKLLIRVPDGLKKSAELDIEVAGEKSNHVALEIRPETERTQKRKEDVDRYENGTVAPVTVIRLDPPNPLWEKGSLLIKVGGAAQLPNGCNLDLTLKLGSDTITSIQATVEDQRFVGTFGPYRKALFSGNYWVDAYFDIDDQAKRIRKAFTEAYPDALTFSAHRHGTDRQACRIGTPAREVEELKEIREHIAGDLARARLMLADLEQGFASAGRSCFRGPDGKVAEKDWEEWLAIKSLRNVPEDERPARAKALREKARFLLPDGALNEPAWREWVDHKVRADLADLAQAHMTFRERYMVIKYPEAMVRLEELFTMLGTLSAFRSRELYSRNNLPAAKADESEGTGQVVKVGPGKMSPAEIDLAIRKIEHEAALTDAEEQAAMETMKKLQENN